MADLYYCNACGLRLKPEELEVAVSRGESPASACCEKCSKPGRPAKAAPVNPLISDVPLLDAEDLPRSPKPTPVKGARTTPQGNASHSGRVLRNTPDGVIRPEVARAARNSPAGGVRIDNLRAQRNTPSPPARPETSQAARVTRRGSAATGSDRRGNERPVQRDAGLPLASLLAGAGAVLFLVGILFATRSGNKTVEVDSRTTVTPATNDSKGDDKKSVDNSAKLPDVKRPPMSGADERRMADFERGLPQTIGAAPRSNVIYGPSGASSQALWKEGRESLYKPEGKPPFLDGSQKVFFQLNGSAGSVTKETFVIEYSAATNVDVYVYFDLADFGARGGMLRFPSGTMQKIEVSPDDDSVLKLGKRGNASGHAINGFGFEAKGVQPGTFGVFRISR